MTFKIVKNSWIKKQVFTWAILPIFPLFSWLPVSPGSKLESQVSQLPIKQSNSNTINFADIRNHWARECILQLTQRNIIRGYPDGTFRPEASITRAEFASLIQGAFPDTTLTRQAITFSDVPANFWGNSAIRATYRMGFLSGYPNNLFRPNVQLPRVQAIVALANGLRYSALPNPTAMLQNYFEDAAQIPTYGTGVVAAAAQQGLVVNYPNLRQFKPNQNATRAEVASFICQALKIPAVSPQYIVGLFEIAPRFDAANRFENGLAQVYLNNKVGYIDKIGKFVIPANYNQIESFSEGILAVRVNGLIGYIDSTGKAITPFKYETGYPFANGFAVVTIADKYGYINREGQEITRLEFFTAFPFSEGLGAVAVGTFNNFKFGYVNEAGSMVIQPQFDEALPFMGNIAKVKINGKIGIINQDGVLVTSPQFDEVADSFTEGLARVKVGTKYGYIDTAGKIAIAPQFDDAFDFSEGLAAVKINGKYGYINPSGTIVIQPTFEPVELYTAGSFSQGLALIQSGNQYGFIDKTGQVVIEPKFSWVSPFNAVGLAQVRVNNKIAFIDKTGKIVSEEFDLVEEFFEGMARVMQNNKVGYIDRTGKLVVEPIFDGLNFAPSDSGGYLEFKSFGQFSEGLAAVEVNKKWGYIDKTGKFVIQPIFDSAGLFSEGLAPVNVGGTWSSGSAYVQGGKWGYIQNPIRL